MEVLDLRNHLHQNKTLQLFPRLVPLFFNLGLFLLIRHLLYLRLVFFFERFDCSVARFFIDARDDIACEVDDLFKVRNGHVQKKSYL